MATIGFDRMTEYGIVVQNYAQVSARRQFATSVFVTLNVLFLSAVGLIVLQSRLSSWWAVVLLSATNLATIPINLTWYRTMRRYQQVLQGYYAYLQEIENEFQQVIGTAAGSPTIGMYRRQGPAGIAFKYGVNRLEKQLALYFLFLYPGLTAAIAAATLWAMSGSVLPLTLP